MDRKARKDFSPLHIKTEEIKKVIKIMKKDIKKFENYLNKNRRN
jgi:hypothetical protein